MCIYSVEMKIILVYVINQTGDFPKDYDNFV